MNIDLLIKRLIIIGIPDVIVSIISVWPKNISFYVMVVDESLDVHLLDAGTVQGSILGPILYAIFVSPMFDLAKMTLFADDNYLVCWNRTVQELIDDTTKTIELVIKWLHQSGLKVNC